MTALRRAARFGVTALGVAVGLAACASGPDESSLPTVESCIPVPDDQRTPVVSLQDRQGEYRLVMVRAGGDTPSGVLGRVELVPRADGAIVRDGYASVLQGTADIELERVGAQRVGSLDATDPAAPGVLVLERVGAMPEVIVRFGSTANRTDRVAFDEAFTALYVRSVTEDGFAGDWRSGLRGTAVEGHFCAARLSE